MAIELKELLKSKCGEREYQKLLALENPALLEFVAGYAEHCNPKSIFVRTDSAEDAVYIKEIAVKNNEEQKAAIAGHTVHFDGYQDQARDKENTRYLLAPGEDLGTNINSIEKEKGEAEVQEYLKNIMAGKEAYICFFCLGPVNSPFSIAGVQITDSAYVAHSEGILYRSGYEEFKRLKGASEFFKLVHSAGELAGGVSKNVDKRRVYIDLDNYMVYSTNTQYAGNTVGFKKLSLRLAIHKASREGWLAEHMLVIGVYGPGGRLTYFTGAFPSACGKTSTAMLEGERIIGDDIAYLRIKDGRVYAVNVECGIFGIIRDVNSKDDPLIWAALTKPGDVIFSNILVTAEGKTYWLNDGRETPERGMNFSGEWFKGKKDKNGKEITHSHANARYTVSLYALENCDPRLDDPQGVEVKGIIYGGRDSDTWVPLLQAFDWAQGVITLGAALESETTAATLGKVGVRKFNPMSNLDFVASPLGKYIGNHLAFGQRLTKAAAVFGVNYFLKGKDGRYLTGMKDKHVWLKWMELRVNGDVEAIKTPMGYIPKYTDLKKIFKELLNKDYPETDYVEQFTLRIPENLAKIVRITGIYKTKVTNVPGVFFKVMAEQEQRLKDAQASYGDYISPLAWI